MRFSIWRKTIDVAPSAAVLAEVPLYLLHESQTESLTSIPVLNVKLRYVAVLRRVNLQVVIFRILGNRSCNAADDRATVIGNIDYAVVLTHFVKEPSDIPLRIKIAGPSGPVEFIQRSDIRLQFFDVLDERRFISIPKLADFHWHYL